MTTSLCSIGFIDDTLQWISSKPSSAGVLTVTGEPLSDLSFVAQIEGRDSMANDTTSSCSGPVCVFAKIILNPALSGRPMISQLLAIPQDPIAKTGPVFVRTSIPHIHLPHVSDPNNADNAKVSENQPILSRFPSRLGWNIPFFLFPGGHMQKCVFEEK